MNAHYIIFVHHRLHKSNNINNSNDVTCRSREQMESFDFCEPHHDVISEEWIWRIWIAHQRKWIVGNNQTIDNRPERSWILWNIELRNKKSKEKKCNLFSSVFLIMKRINNCSRQLSFSNHQSIFCYNYVEGLFSAMINVSLASVFIDHRELIQFTLDCTSLSDEIKLLSFSQSS